VPAGERALFMYATPRNYIASILAGKNSVREMQMLADTRAKRMAGRVTGLDGTRRSGARLAAAAWACEMTALEEAADAMADRRILWADFDAMLADMAAALRPIADHFAFAADDARLAELASGPLMTRYSKALEYEYSPGLRRELIAEAGHHHRREIDEALAMLRASAEKSPLLARALARGEES
jgi:hypothetical protein